MSILVSVALVISALFLMRRTLQTLTGAVAVSALVFWALFLCVVYYISDSLTGSGIDASVLYHLGTGFEGAAIGDFTGTAALAVTLFLVALGVSIFSIRFLRNRTLEQKHPLRIGAALLLLAASFYVNPATSDLTRLYAKSDIGTANVEVSDLPDQFAPASPLVFNETPKNFVVLYLESVERTYLDQSLFPGLMPNLVELEKQALSFTDITEVEEAGWTIAGMVAGQCGIPLTGSGAGVDEFLPGAVCLGDLLEEQNFDLTFLGGADLDFAGKGTFYETHGFAQVEGRDELMHTLDSPDYLSAWGLFDDSLYAVATDRFDQLAQQEGPYGLVVLTVDTHHPFGYLANACGEESFQDLGNKFLDAVHCADKMAAEFIHHVLNSPDFEDTILVVLSDHMAMPNQVRDQLEQGERRNLLLFFGQDIENGLNGKPGTTLDFAPTLLSLIGAKTDALGFSRDLRSANPTLRAGETPLETLISQSRAFLSTLWSFPSLNNGLVADLENNRILLGERYAKWPVLFLLDEALEITEISFDLHSDVTLSERVARLGFDQRFVWVDSCDAITSFNQRPGTGTDEMCALFGTLGSVNLGSFAFAEDNRLDFPKIQEMFAGPPPSQEYFDTFVADLVRKRQFAASEVIDFVPSSGLVGDFAIRSAGYTQGDSWILNREVGGRINLMRGLTLLGLNADAEPVKIGHTDTCGYGGRVFDTVRLQTDFKTAMENNEGRFGAFAIVSHNSMVCYEVETDLESLFKGTGLEVWRDLWYEQPYVALFSGNGDISEFFGERQTAMGLEARDFIRQIEPTNQRQLLWLPRIAHAGGGYKGDTYTNSLEALNTSAPYYDLIEIDLSWTSDGHLVCLHDWEQGFLSAAGRTVSSALTLAEFETLAQANPEFESCTLDTLADWLRANNSVRIVTDIKDNVLEALRHIATTHPDIQARFVPQVYQPQNYAIARELGFEDVIWTLYRYEGDTSAILNWLKQMDLFGLTMHPDWVETGLARAARDTTGVLSWTHTINTPQDFDMAVQAGVAEVFTDFLTPTNVARFEAFSSGFGAGESFVRLVGSESALALPRGLTLVGLSGGNMPEILANFDSCAKLETGALPDPVPFSAALQAQAESYDALAVVAHDSALCGDRSLETVFAGSPFSGWPEIGFREPYIGMVGSEGRVIEFNGATESQLHAVLAVTVAPPR